MREEAIEAPVEDAGGDEGVDVADVETARLISVTPTKLRSTLASGKALCEQVACGEREGKRLTDVDHPQ